MNHDIGLPTEKMDYIQKMDKKLFLQVTSTFLVVFTTAGILSVFGVSGVTASVKPFFQYAARMATKVGNVGIKLAGFILKHPILAAAATLIITEGTGLTNIVPKPKDWKKYAKYAGGAVALYFGYKLFKKVK